LTESAAQLEQQFQQIAEELTADPIARTDDGTRATDSALRRDRQGSMAASATAQATSEMATAATAAREAVKHLERGRAVPAGSGECRTPRSTEVGQQVTGVAAITRRQQLTGIDQPKNGDESARR
jgi:hypothetical protein